MRVLGVILPLLLLGGCLRPLAPSPEGELRFRVARVGLETITAILRELPARNHKIHLQEEGETRFRFLYKEGWVYAELLVRCFTLEDGRLLIRSEITRSSLGAEEEEILKEFWRIFEDLSREHRVPLEEQAPSLQSLAPSFLVKGGMP